MSITVIATLLLSTFSFAATAIPVEVKEGEKNFKGALFVPEKATGPLPLVLVVHEWWGKTEHPETRAKKIADELGYAALAVDLFGDGKTVSTPPEAQALATPFYKEPMMGVTLLKNFIAAAPEAAKQAGVTIDTMKIASIGFCFGGSQSLNLARAGKLADDQKLLGVVSFHGGLASGLKAQGSIAAKVLVLHGEADKMVSSDEVKAFKLEMKAAKVDLKFHAYPGALHAFTNLKATAIGKQYKIPIAYNAKADKDSWLRMKSFLGAIFK